MLDHCPQKSGTQIPNGRFSLRDRGCPWNSDGNPRLVTRTSKDRMNSKCVTAKIGAVPSRRIAVPMERYSYSTTASNSCFGASMMFACAWSALLEKFRTMAGPRSARVPEASLNSIRERFEFRNSVFFEAGTLIGHSSFEFQSYFH